MRGLGHRDVKSLAKKLRLPDLPILIRRFLFHQENPDSGLAGDEIPLTLCPEFDGRLHVVSNAVAVFYAPSDDCGVGGMRREIIRSTAKWRGASARRDCVFVVHDNEQPGFRGLYVARVMLFFKFKHNRVTYPCALVTWFSTIGDDPCDQTGMWQVEPDLDASGNRVMEVIHIDALLRSAHLLPIPGEDRIPANVNHTQTLDIFRAFYVNKFADNHAHQIAF